MERKDLVNSWWDTGIRHEEFGYAHTDRIPVCYISGPMTGLPNFNKHSFEKASQLLREAHWRVFSPHENDAEAGIQLEGKTGMEVWEGTMDEFSFKDAMARDLWQVCKSDAVIVLPGWEYSAGTQIEVDVAHRVGVPVFTLLHQRQIEAPEWAPHEFSSRPPAEGSPTPDHAEEPQDPAVPSAGALDFGPTWRETYEPTGGQKGRREATLSLIPIYALIQESRVHGGAVKKYPDEAPGVPNWSKGTPWSWMADAALRHFYAWLAGESFDPESGLHALAHVRWMCATLMEYERLGVGLDDRRRQV